MKMTKKKNMDKHEVLGQANGAIKVKRPSGQANMFQQNR